MGVPLVALLGILTLVFRSVILAPETARPGGTYTEGVVGQLGTLNPLFGGAAAGSNDLDALLFEPLVRVLPNGSIQALLASHWEVSPDQRSYVFTLRSNARWSDGSPLAADGVVFHVRTVQAPPFHVPPLHPRERDILDPPRAHGPRRLPLPSHTAPRK